MSYAADESLNPTLKLIKINKSTNQSSESGVQKVSQLAPSSEVGAHGSERALPAKSEP